jgi:hypothetical protein
MNEEFKKMRKNTAVVYFILPTTCVDRLRKATVNPSDDGRFSKLRFEPRPQESKPEVVTTRRRRSLFSSIIFIS